MARISQYQIDASISDEDQLLGSDAENSNATKRFTVGALAAYINGESPGSPGSGTVTSVSGEGTVSGITLSGEVTSSGSLTLGGSLSLTSQQVIDFLGYTPSSFDGDYNNLTNKPSLFDGTYNSLTGKPTLFDGDYDNLTNKPAIPDAVFKNFAVDGQTTVVADSVSDTLTLVAGDNITIATDSALDTITINALATLNNNFAEDIIVNGVNIGAGSSVNTEENTRIGRLSLGNSTGDFNTAVGYAALRYSNTGQYNTAVGNHSMSQYQITGIRNTGVGWRALRALSSGLNNVAVGDSALVSLTGGSANVAIGNSALDLLVNEDHNVSIGNSSLGGLVNGERNVAVGSASGGGTRNNLNDSVFVGYQASSNSDGQTNQIVIGSQVVGKGSNTATIGNNNITALHVGGDGAGIVLKSPNGTAYKITVSDAGAITATAV